jgi:hypothetical protein
MRISRSASKTQQLEMQLEDAIQMLRLVAASKRTCLEVEEWLNLTYPDTNDECLTLTTLLKQTKVDPQ